MNEMKLETFNTARGPINCAAASSLDEIFAPLRVMNAWLRVKSR